ncbi:hypothetical protein SESBI_35395 [Sesbania bispinosa]|nr:hypothetical protein SESBI_35395 [Sesbania bispinosa]
MPFFENENIRVLRQFLAALVRVRLPVDASRMDINMDRAVSRNGIGEGNKWPCMLAGSPGRVVVQGGVLGGGWRRGLVELGRERKRYQEPWWRMEWCERRLEVEEEKVL